MFGTRYIEKAETLREDDHEAIMAFTFHSTPANAIWETLSRGHKIDCTTIEGRWAREETFLAIQDYFLENGVHGLGYDIVKAELLDSDRFLGPRKAKLTISLLKRR